MAKRRVLIVDDSKTAQMRLRKMLERYDLDTDTVLSAEEALGYLSYRHPAVIFLDHHMEGMDGLEALKIIKSNPATALIPVIMYTSEQGDVYVGQARALGAMDILGKEVMKPANLEKVLAGLGIVPIGQEPKGAEPPAQAIERGRDVVAPFSEYDPHVYSPSEEYLSSDDYGRTPEPEGDLDQVQKQISRLFEIHIAKVRQEIEDSTKFLLRRMAKDLQDKPRQRARPAVSDAPADESVNPPEDSYRVTEAPERSGVSTVLLGVILLAVAFLGYHLYLNNQHQVVLSEQYQELIQRHRAQEDLVERVIAQAGAVDDGRAAAAQSFADRQVWLDALGWAVNVNTQVPFGERSLSDQRIYMLGELLALLKATNFAGVVFLDLHLGNFCVVEDPNGNWILPEPESNVEDCRFLENVRPDVSSSELVSVGFMNYLQSAPILAQGDIEVDIAPQGYNVHRYSYPASTNAVSAGEWNAIAQKNNRIMISFSAN